MRKRVVFRVVQRGHTPRAGSIGGDGEGHARSLPVAQRPITLVILNMWVTSVASMSLSCDGAGKGRARGERASDPGAVRGGLVGTGAIGRRDGRARRGVGVPELSSASRRTRCPCPGRRWT